MKTYKPTITIGIPAYNEESNIANLLNSILQQKSRNYLLQKIVVANDASNDSTADIVNKYSKMDKRVHLLNGRKRQGQAKRLEQMHQINESDLFVTFDADTLLGNDLVVEEIVKQFIRCPKVGLVGGNCIPAKPKSFVEKLAVVWINAWSEIRIKYKGGENIHNHLGHASAIRGSLAKKAKMSQSTFPNDAFLYLRVKQMGFGFKLAKEAVVYYRAPSNLRDYLLQTSRFLKSASEVGDFFGKRLDEEFYIPRSYKFKQLIRFFLKEPIYFPLSIMLQVFVRLNKVDNFQNKGIWHISDSTKIGTTN